MRPTTALLAASAVAMALSACTFVDIQPGGKGIRVAPSGTPLTCEKRGEISVSVKDRLGPLERGELKVRDELEVLARNEAPGLGADTVQAMDEPMDGEQRFSAWRCGGAVQPRGAAPTTVEQLPEGEAETLPLRQD